MKYWIAGIIGGIVTTVWSALMFIFGAVFYYGIAKSHETKNVDFKVM